MPSYEPKPGQYDARLLEEAPQTTRAAKQEGYNVDLLNQPHPAGGSSNSLQEPATTQPVAPNRNVYTAPTPADAVPQPYTSPKIPWYRTTCGILILAIVALVIIGAVVGGAVGGTVGKNKSNKSAAPGSTSSTSASSAAAPSGSGDGSVGQGSGTTQPGLGETSQTAAVSQSGTGALETGTPQRRRRMRI